MPEEYYKQNYFNVLTNIKRAGESSLLFMKAIGGLESGIKILNVCVDPWDNDYERMELRIKDAKKLSFYHATKNTPVRNISIDWATNWIFGLYNHGFKTITPAVIKQNFCEELNEPIRRYLVQQSEISKKTKAEVASITDKIIF